MFRASVLCGSSEDEPMLESCCITSPCTNRSRHACCNASIVVRVVQLLPDVCRLKAGSRLSSHAARTPSISKLPALTVLLSLDKGAALHATPKAAASARLSLCSHPPLLDELKIRSTCELRRAIRSSKRLASTSFWHSAANSDPGVSASAVLACARKPVAK